MKVKRLKIIGAFIVISLMMTSANIWAQDAAETSMEETLEMMSDDEEEDFIEKDLLSDSDIVRAMTDSLETDPLAQEEMAFEQTARDIGFHLMNIGEPVRRAVGILCEESLTLLQAHLRLSLVFRQGGGGVVGRLRVVVEPGDHEQLHVFLRVVVE